VFNFVIEMSVTKPLLVEISATEDHFKSGTFEIRDSGTFYEKTVLSRENGTNENPMLR
jgi:hypothetical protein